MPYALLNGRKSAVLVCGKKIVFRRLTKTPSIKICIYLPEKLTKLTPRALPKVLLF